MEIKGTIILDIPKVEGVSKAGNAWQKKEWVLETVDTPYPRKVMFHFFGDRANTPLEVGKTYIITCEPESREFNGRWYTDIRGISAMPVEAPNAGGMGQPFVQQPSMQPGMGQPFTSPVPDAGFTSGDGDGDLPF